MAGKSVAKLSIYEVANLLTGPEGRRALCSFDDEHSARAHTQPARFPNSIVELSWRPAAGGPPRSASLVREAITLRAVSSALCDAVPRGDAPAAAEPRVGYVRVGAFSAATPSGVADALAALRSGGAEALVLDLRSNGGGSFPAGVEVAKQLIPKARLL